MMDVLAEDRSARARLAASALAILSVDPRSVGGLWLKARPGPARDRFLHALRDRLPSARKIPVVIDDATLLGGLDLAQTLGTGSLVMSEGVLSRSREVILPMAERCPPRLAAHLAQAIDDGTHAVVAIDEGENDEAPPTALRDRLGLVVSLDDVRADDLALVRSRYTSKHARLSEADIEALVTTAQRLGIASLRAPMQAAAAAEAHATAQCRETVSPDDIAVAVQLVYAHRATLIPEIDQETAPEADHSEPSSENGGESEGAATDMLVDAVRAVLSSDILAGLSGGAVRARRTGSGAGAAKKGSTRGRPLPARPGHTTTADRIDVPATLRAAAPWQTLRGRQAGAPLRILPSDLRLRRTEDRSDRLVIFVVDASGSQAMARLAETKGAVEILLSEAYARRDHVALIAFRGTEAEVLLPPTRSLVQTKRRLGAMPGGGGTPLAAGLLRARDVAEAAQSKGLSPTLVVLTDGRANIALDGSADRAAAHEDAETVARTLREVGAPTMLIDTGVRPNHRALEMLAHTMGGDYIPLPRADAQRLSAAVSTALVE